MSIEEFNNYLSEDSLEKALQKLESVIVNSGKIYLKHHHSNLSARFSNYKKNQISGIYSIEQDILHRNRLRVSLEKLGHEVYAENHVYYFLKRFKLILLLIFIIILFCAVFSIVSTKSINKDTFTLTVSINTINDIRENCIVQNEELVALFGGGVTPAKIDEYCRAIFLELSNSFRRNEIPFKFNLRSKTYELIYPDSLYTINNLTDVIHIDIQRRQSLSQVKGRIWEADNQTIVKNAQVEVDGEITYSDSLGLFELNIPIKKQTSDYYELIIRKLGYETLRSKYKPKSTRDDFTLTSKD